MLNLSDADLAWPRHKASLHVTHNQHKAYYETIEKYAAADWAEVAEWVSAEEKAKAIAEDSIWELQWYPDTPVGSFHIAASTLEACLKAAKEIMDAEPK